MTDAIAHRRDAFIRDHLAWIAVHHFLPADMLRALCDATIAATTDGAASIEDLFFETLAAPDGVTNTWAIELKPVSDKGLRHLQDRIRALAWANDAEIFSPRSETAQPASAFEALRHAVHLGQLDLEARPHVFSALIFPEGSTVAIVAAAISQASAFIRSGEDGYDGLEALEPLDPLLRSLALKHLGDLFADVDDWGLAAKAYRQASRALVQVPLPIWGDFVQQMGDIIAQSLAMATWALEGTVAAAKALGAVVDSASDRSRLIVLNGAHDAMVAALRSEAFASIPDRRPTVLFPPQLITSHDVGPALRNTQNRRYDDAYRHFWSTLRRQTALGAISETRATKAAYGRALLAQVADETSDADDGTFSLGIRLLVESGSFKAAETAPFTNSVVERLLAPTLIAEMIKRVERHLGSRLERSLVFLELVRQWVAKLPREANDVALPLLNWTVGAAHAPVTFETQANVGGRALQVLSALAELQPQFRALVADQIADLVIEKIRSDEFWTGPTEALKLAKAYKDAWSGETLVRVSYAVVDYLAAVDPARELWHIVRPGLEFLNSQEVIEAARAEPELGSQFLSSVLKLGFAQKTEETQTLFNIRRLEGDVVLSSEDKKRLDDVVEAVRRRAKEINSASATDAIRALLIAPAYSRAEGVEFAIHQLNRVLATALDRSPSPAFAYAYGPVIDLARSLNYIQEQSGILPSKLEDALDQVAERLTVAWRQIAEEPALLGGFSIPPSTKPHPTIVQNWCVATVRLVRRLRHPEALLTAFRAAGEVSSFSNAVRLAQIETQMDGATDGLESITSEPARIFYPALASRLALLGEKVDLDARLVEALLTRALQIGPRELDLAIFSTALRFSTKISLPVDLIEGYLSVLKGDLRQILLPAVYALQSKLEGNDVPEP